MIEDARKYAKRLAAHWTAEEISEYFSNAIFIVSAPRAGSTLLFTLLASTSGIWTIGGESHGVYGQFPHLRGEDQDMTSGRLFRTHADRTTCERMRLLYASLLTDFEGRRFYDEISGRRQKKIIFLEKTPRNALNIDFLSAAFPSARFIFLHRDPRENISSLMEGWRVGADTGQFVTYKRLPDWPKGYWCFILPPDWRALKEASIADIAAFQWRACNDIILDDLSKLEADRWTGISYRDLIASPQSSLKRLCKFCGVEPGAYLNARTAENLPISASTVTPPHPDKWRRHEREIIPLLPGLRQTMTRLSTLSATNA